jgi:hypothetical protein
MTVTWNMFAAPPTRDAEDELRKKITAILLHGVQHIHLDNWVVPIKGAVMSSLLTSDVWTARVLNVSEMASVPARMALFASGNNTTVVQDMVPRSIQVRLKTDLERPETRTNFRHDDLIGYIKENRSTLLTDLYTIIRGFRQAGSPNLNNVTLGRFEGWARNIAAMVDWVTGYNVVDSQADLFENDPEDQTAAECLAALREVYADKSFTAAQVADETNFGGCSPTMKRLSEVVDIISPNRSSRVIGAYFRGVVDQNVGGLALRRDKWDGHRKINRWRVEPVNPGT